MTTYTFNPGNQPVRVETMGGEPWFVAKDVCDALTISNNRDAVALLDEDEKLMSVITTSGQGRQMWLVNESGLYNLIFQSRKPEARKFRKWVTSEVLPSIRRTGGYMMPGLQPRPLCSGYVKPRDRSEHHAAFYRELRRWVRLSDVAGIVVRAGVTRSYVFQVLAGATMGVPVLEQLAEAARLNRQRGLHSDIRTSTSKADEKLLQLCLNFLPETANEEGGAL